MDTIDIVKFPPYASNETLQVLSYHLDRECNRITLKEVNWPDTYPYRPDIHFRIAYNEQHIFLKFDVHENEFRATEITDCGHVWEDSCVELFIQLEDGDGYYNIEINAIGTILCAYGTGRENRSLMPMQISTTILRDSTIKFNNENQDEAFYQWSLIIRFPHTAFFKHTFMPLPEPRSGEIFINAGTNFPTLTLSRGIRFQRKNRISIDRNSSEHLFLNN